MEHRVVIDVVHETLLPWCSYLDWEAEPSIVTVANVQHLGTLIEGRLSSPAPNVLELVEALSPTPALGGHPRAEALELIAAVEGFDRGRYGGAVGWVDADGNGTWAVAIRCAEIEGMRARLFAGGGIVADSDPHAELAALGATPIGPAASIAQALSLIERASGGIDGALLDLNLRGQIVVPVLDALAPLQVPVLVVSGPAGALQMSEAGPGAHDHAPSWAVRAERLSSTYGCSTSGLEPGVYPARAVVRHQGEVRVASFEEGWAMYRGEVPGTLIAVCRR